MHPFFPAHDLTHCAVESVLGFDEAFFGLVASGWDIDDFAAPGAAARMPAQALWAEHIVGLLMLERTNATGYAAAEFNDMLTAALEHQGVPPFRPLSDAERARARERGDALQAAWHAVALGDTLEVPFPVGQLARRRAAVTAFQDHFSAIAATYARARPTYPAALYAQLAAASPGRAAAWDCGTGNGQAAHGLAAHFSAVLATDPSAAQLAEALPHPRVTFRLAREAASGLASGAVDLVTAAQAAHWFDLDAFYAEARRVLRPGGVLALWCYGLCRVAPAVDELLNTFYAVTVGPYWPPGRHHVDAAYRSLAFPFPELPFPPLVMEQQWRLGDLGAYVRTWSAVTRFVRERGFDPVAPLLRDLAPVWGSPEEPRPVWWPLAGRLGRLPAELGHR